MTIQTLAWNVRRCRIAGKLSQTALAKASGISLPAIRNIEQARHTPRMRTVHAIAQALKVPLQDLFRQTGELRTVRFRATRRMQNRENILAQVSHWLENYLYLESLLAAGQTFRLSDVGSHWAGKDPVGAANACRVALGLREAEPIHDLCGLLEHAGVKAFLLPTASDGFFGLSIGLADGGPAMVINIRDRIPVERRIFSAAHELGHLILHPEAYDVTLTEESAAEEREADRFAGHFLMPDTGFCKEWAETAGLPLVDRVFKVRGIFRVSYKTVLFRLLELGTVDDRIWVRFQSAFQQRFHRKLPFREEPMGLDPAEPFGMSPFEFSGDRFSRLIRQAIEEEKISLSRGAEMLDVSLADMQDLMASWEYLLAEAAL